MKGCKMLTRVFKAKNLGHIICLPVLSELQVVSIFLLIWMFLKADQAELVFSKYDAAFTITTIVSVEWFEQVKCEKRQQEQQKGFLSKTYTYS